MNKFISVLIIVLCLGLFTNCYAGITDQLPVDRYSSKYDTHFQKYSKRFFGPTFQWKYFKAQAICESALKPNARSHCNAMGVMQIMKPTWKEIALAIDVGNDPFNVRNNICAGIYYDKRMWNIWKAKRSFDDRIRIVFASYNGGAGNIMKSQKLCLAAGGKNCNSWIGIKSQAHNVRSWICDESIKYVDRIMGLMNK